MRVQYKFFRGTLATWDELFSQAAEFATEVGFSRLINISHAVAGSNGTVTVWYWVDDQAGTDAAPPPDDPADL